MSRKIQEHKLFEIYQEARGKRIFTKSILPGITHFDERILRDKSDEYREFDPKRSKLAAMIMKGCTNMGIRKDNVILYLGSSHGYTPSFVSDIVGEDGLIFGIDPAPRVMRDFVFLAEKRKNLVPILADANHPEQYQDKICQADIVYQDVAQRNQADIFIRNCQLYLKKGGYGLLAVKARSIDIKKKPKQIFIEIRTQLDKIFTVIDYKTLDPFEKDHCLIIIKK
ncbi:MAG: fibrillarin-like rRNA/tRNA 2'-O-methyltransferase [Nanoarchaeota archaeon]|nr:fibrillarin-like rRNA/tRNA 2'-O-methyltransferase [Nanoarchaeota archaeon]MBU1622627.1 fibrillarin-like rRNA/tRNA 2'-O-methyltransferase [Nanoarchaeota archaeon]MBU1974008.1 fibrillarin-like rRNA/tRNA 2'-O-methyltransferase [Nanoarchaeota archaeon]